MSRQTAVALRDALAAADDAEADDSWSGGSPRSPRMIEVWIVQIPLAGRVREQPQEERATDPAAADAAST